MIVDVPIRYLVSGYLRGGSMERTFIDQTVVPVDIVEMGEPTPAYEAKSMVEDFFLLTVQQPPDNAPFRFTKRHATFEDGVIRRYRGPVSALELQKMKSGVTVPEWIFGVKYNIGAEYRTLHDGKQTASDLRQIVFSNEAEVTGAVLAAADRMVVFDGGLWGPAYEPVIVVHLEHGVATAMEVTRPGRYPDGYVRPRFYFDRRGDLNFREFRLDQVEEALDFACSRGADEGIRERFLQAIPITVSDPQSLRYEPELSETVRRLEEVLDASAPELYKLPRAHIDSWVTMRDAFEEWQQLPAADPGRPLEILSEGFNDLSEYLPADQREMTADLLARQAPESDLDVLTSFGASP